MSRVANTPISLAAGLDVDLDGQHVTVKGSQGTMEMSMHPAVAVQLENNILSVKPVSESKAAWAMAGTMRALLNNMIVGVSSGFQKKLQLVGVGYRAQAKDKVLSLNLGFSHPIAYLIPENISITTPSQTEIIIFGCDKQRVGQVAAEIRRLRPPEPYKGKGIRYIDEYIIRKEAKKK